MDCDKDFWVFHLISKRDIEPCPHCRRKAGWIRLCGCCVDPEVQAEFEASPFTQINVWLRKNGGALFECNHCKRIVT